MAYTVKGFNYPIEDMSVGDREWYLKRVDKQLRSEAKAIKKGNKGK